MGVTDGQPPNGGGPPGSGSSDVPVLTAVQDFDGYTLSINDVHRDVLGWSVDELSAVPFWELVHPDDQDGLMEDRQQMLLDESGLTVALRVCMLCSDGTHCLIRWHMRADAEDERIYLSGVDVSDQELFVPGKRSLVGSWDWDVDPRLGELVGRDVRDLRTTAGVGAHPRYRAAAHAPRRPGGGG